MVIRRCAEYFRQEANYFVDFHEERRPPGRPPSWTDGEGVSTYVYTSEVSRTEYESRIVS